MSILNYNALQDSLRAAGVEHAYHPLNKRWDALKIFRGSTDSTDWFWARHSRRGWFLGDKDVFRVPESSNIADVCLGWAKNAVSRQDLIHSFGLAIQPTWLADEFNADQKLWESVGWQRLSESEDKMIYDALDKRLNYPGNPFLPPRPSATWDFSYLYDRDLPTFEQSSMQINLAVLLSFRQILRHTECLIAIDWSHFSYRLALNATLNSGDSELWPISVFPDGDYHLFVSGDFRFGIVSDPTSAQVCAFGEQLPRILASQLGKTPLDAQMIGASM